MLREETSVAVTGTIFKKGRVEVCINGRSGTICADDREQWSNEDAAVACRQLGLNPNGICCDKKMDKVKGWS